MTTTNILDKIIAETKLSKKETTKQQRVVETAISMFAEKGFANTSTKEIAIAAGVSEGTLFRHYGTKENLLMAVILPFLKDLIPIMAHELVDEFGTQEFDSFEEFLRVFLDNRIQFLKDNKEIFQIVIKEFLYREELRVKLMPYFNNEFLSFFYTMLNQFKNKGELVDIPNERLIKMILSFMISYSTLRFIILPEQVINDESTEIDNLIQFIMNGIKKH